MPGLGIVLATTIWPIFIALRNSLMEWNLSRSSEPSLLWSLDSDGWEGIGFLFENYLNSFKDPLVANSIQVTAIFTFFSVFFTILFSLGLSLMLYRGGWFRSIYRTLLLLPFAMSPALVGVSFRFLFNADFGFLNAVIGEVFPFLKGVDMLGDGVSAMVILVLCDVWHWTPYMTMLLISGLVSVPVETKEAAMIDGAGTWRIFKDIVLPSIYAVMGISLILKTIFSLKMFDQVFNLTNGGPGNATQTLAHYIYFQGFKYYDLGYASAISFWLILPMLFLSIIYMRLIFR